jgi:hypothetical protein
LEDSTLATRVRFAIPEQEIGNSGISFRRELDEGLHGDLTIRQNHIDWRPKDKQFIYRVTWDKFAAFAQAEGTRQKPKATVVKARKRLKPVA